MRNNPSISELTWQAGKNTFWMIISRFGTQALAVVFTVFLARRLDSSGFGAYAFLAAILFVANTLTTFGTDMLLIREIASTDDLGRLPAALLIQLVISAAIILMIWLGAGGIPNQSPQTLLALRIYSLALIPLAFFTVFTTQLRGQQRLEAYMLLNLATALLQLGAVFIRNLDILKLSIYLVIVQCAVAILAGWMCRRQFPDFRLTWPADRMLWSGLLKEAAPIALLAVLGIIYQRLSIAMLSTINGAAQTGLYAAAARIVEASKGFHLAVFAALYPMMSQAGGEGTDPSKWRDLFNASWKILLGGACLIAIGISFLASPLVYLLYGIHFSGSVRPLIILSWSLIPYTVNTFLTLKLLAEHRETLVVKVLAASLIGLTAMNFWLIPLKGSEGSAWAVLAAESLQAGLLVTFHLRSGQKKRRYELSQLPE